MSGWQVVRRLLSPLTVALVVVGMAICWGLVVAGLAMAPLDRRLRLARIGLLGVTYMCLEILGLGAYLGTWLLRAVRGRAWGERADQRLVAWVLQSLYRVGGRLTGFAVSVEHPTSPDLADRSRPLLVLARHGGFGDSFALVWLLASCWDRRPRVVLKRMLMVDPLADVALHRLGACFLRSADPGRLDRVRDLATSLRPGDALLLFPEGANWTPRRRVHAVWRLWARAERKAARHALLMEHVLPPRPGGVGASLDGCPGAQVVVVAHTGLDTLTTVGAVWRAIPFDVAMTVRWWEAPTPPTTAPGRQRWLTSEWAVVDEWIDVRRIPGP